MTFIISRIYHEHFSYFIKYPYVKYNVGKLYKVVKLLSCFSKKSNDCHAWVKDY